MVRRQAAELASLALLGSDRQRPNLAIRVSQVTSTLELANNPTRVGLTRLWGGIPSSGAFAGASD